MEDGGNPCLIWILTGIIFVLTALTAVIAAACRETLRKKIKNIMNGKRPFNPDDVTEEEIISMVNEGHEQGVLQESEAEMIHNIFAFDDKEAKDIMVHRKNIVALSGDLSYTDAVVEMHETNRSRYPVYVDDIDHIIGVLHIKDAFSFAQRNEIFRTSIKDIPELIREVDFIPETMKINELFQTMQLVKNHMAVVVDEYGQTAGIVAMEDILEEIVGNIEDEHDQKEEFVRQNEDGSYTMDGLIEFAEAAELLGISAEDEPFDTLNGMLVSLLDKIPGDGETAVIDAYGYEFSILRVENKLIREVMVRRRKEAEKDNS